MDGDTIVVHVGDQDRRLRYIGMDTPETVQPGTPVQWFGPEASQANRALVEGRTVVLEKDVSETDRFGRLLRYVWLVDGGSLDPGRSRARQPGFAQVETDPPDVQVRRSVRGRPAGRPRRRDRAVGTRPSAHSLGHPAGVSAHQFGIALSPLLHDGRKIGT